MHLSKFQEIKLIIKIELNDYLWAFWHIFLHCFFLSASIDGVASHEGCIAFAERAIIRFLHLFTLAHYARLCNRLSLFMLHATVARSLARTALAHYLSS